MFPLKPLECCFSSMLRFIVLLEGEPPPSLKSLEEVWGFQVSLKNTMLHCGDGFLGVMRGVWFAPDIAFSLMVKKLNFSLIWPEYFFFHMFGESPTCGVYCLKWSYGQILQSPLWSFAAPSGLSLVSLLSLWLMPSLPSPWVLVGSLGRFVVVPYSLHFLLYYYYSFLMVLWPVPDLFGELLGLHGAACLVVPLA